MRPVSYGLMKKQEWNARRSGNLFGGKPPLASPIQEAPDYNIKSAQLEDFLYPTLTLIVVTILSMLASGGFTAFGGNNTLFEALQKANAPQALFISGLISLTLVTLFFLARLRFRLKDIPRLYITGAQLMLTTIIMLILAWTLGDIMRQDLLTGHYVGSLIPTSTASGLLMSPLLFLIAFIVAFSIGSSWVTMAIMLPIAIPMVITFAQLPAPVTPEQLPLLSLMLGALFSGAVAGNHISPLADTTLMSASSSGAYLVDHFYAQLQYALAMIFGTLFAFFAASCFIRYGALIAWLCGIFVGCASSIGILSICNRYTDTYLCRHQEKSS